MDTEIDSVMIDCLCIPEENIQKSLIFSFEETFKISYFVQKKSIESRI